MIYLCEREIGFDDTEIGFPSVLGCRAVVAVTAGGLFGFHLNGSLNAGKKAALVGFINGHARGGALRALYAASTGPGLLADYAELRDIANDLHYTGPIYWASLPQAGSSYVNFHNINNTTCAITARAWDDAVDADDANRVPNVVGANRAMANGAANARVYNHVDPAGLKAVYPNAI
ncbi:hypothetical protein FHY55_07805 [Oceanicola sp. D3]|uniref:hypothetical protein n=1 Tax=Oceanicola sp. D3 TaxID=2587163 RepID=UPI00112244FB|nr:hypothetical protein [Oceanicola sp. D3]QDC09151.1 hypothetical protein FHY55_07805 [Oceanicola sp. D3]